jgi:hypothetical protein
MWLEAILSRQDLEHALGELTPTTIHFSHDGELHLDAPTSVVLVEGRGLRVVCRARLRWVVLGLHVPAPIASISLLLEPAVRRVQTDVLVFQVKLEALDVAAIPSMLEATVVHRINAALEERHAELVWDFRETLSHRFPLPDLLAPTRTLDLQIAWGEVRITPEALVFAVSFHMKGFVGPSAAPSVPVPVERPPTALAIRKQPDPKFNAMALGGALAALTVSFLGFALGSLIAKRRKRRHLLDLWTRLA